MHDENKKKRDEIAQLLRDSIVPKKRPPQSITIEKLVIVVPGTTAVEFLTAIREALKE